MAVVHAISYLFPSQSHQHRTTRNCASDLVSADSIRPIAAAGPFLRTRDKSPLTSRRPPHCNIPLHDTGILFNSPTQIKLPDTGCVHFKNIRAHCCIIQSDKPSFASYLAVYPA